MIDPKDFNLLIVDDEEGLRSALKIHFQMDGYNIFTSSNGNAAFEIIKKNKIDFVISDIRMPEGDGEALLQKLRELNPDIPVIVMVTGFAELSREKAIEMGALDLLAKPIDLEKIEKYIEKFRADHSSRNL
mgnify:CR=1 FL=1